VLGYLALLSPSETTVSIDPRPIEVADWKKLLAKAQGDDRAMVLLMLNCAMYLQEVIKLQWSDVREGCLVTHRAKTGKCVRVAVLWKETLDALVEVARRGPFIFYNYAGVPLGIKGAEKRFRDLRNAAGVGVTSSQLRDGAYTAAVEANVTSNLCQLLVGHRSGIADHYVKRKPTMVAPACTAIYIAYFGP
jgi:integrase